MSLNYKLKQTHKSVTKERIKIYISLDRFKYNNFHRTVIESSHVGAQIQ